jgi:hypothetical protein
MLTTQPFFIGGIEDYEKARSSAYGAFGMFLFTFILSLIGIVYDSKKGDVEDDSAEAGYQLARDNIPNYGTSS